ncbi:hypothetical protein P350_23545 [Burkholderia cepacia JBK9]|uniref:Lipoprotein n=1 Tax=Burkholderia arboris TaxID=488730 RepID=A0A9Q9UR19_9BURK|nr:hypothetical protein [Burkholderia arboris]ALX14516.1 hypothetical protein P350_23545 [Burkholderia cepacia JBK9]MCA8490244.1 hypothetical protein [Burkholderia arboris]UTV58838.1 hypothetical protein NLX30_22130 [Burkholderia arboris]VWB56045.1 putative lipoprotein [Burkholderia arboris]
MVKTLVVCGALCLSAAAFERFHEAVAVRPAPAHAFATDATRVAVRHATFDAPGVAPSSNDDNAARQAAVAQTANKPPVVALGVANSGWSALFSH